jgi:SAM-dependent methyltransferase
MNIQVSSNHYLNEGYDHKARWISYWQQIHEVMKVKPQNVLEVGLGSGVTASYIKARGVELKTLDIDASLKPDYAGSVLAMPIQDASFDVVCAFEVLEHLPFSDFEKALREMARVSRKYVFISVPDSRHTLLRLTLKIPFLPQIDWLWKINSWKEHKFDGQHYWEIGKRGYALSRVCATMHQAGLRLVRDYVTPDCPTKHFFVLEK